MSELGIVIGAFIFALVMAAHEIYRAFKYDSPELPPNELSPNELSPNDKAHQALEFFIYYMEVAEHQPMRFDAYTLQYFNAPYRLAKKLVEEYRK